MAQIDPLGNFLFRTLPAIGFGWMARQSKERDREVQQLERERIAEERRQYQEQQRQERARIAEEQRREREQRKLELQRLEQQQKSLESQQKAARQQQLRLVVSRVYQQAISVIAQTPAGKGGLLSRGEIETLARQTAQLVANELRGL